MENIRNDELVLPTQERQVSQELTHILMAMLSKDPATRITLPDLIANPWLNATTTQWIGKQSLDWKSQKCQLQT